MTYEACLLPELDSDLTPGATRRKGLFPLRLRLFNPENTLFPVEAVTGVTIGWLLRIGPITECVFKLICLLFYQTLSLELE